MKVLISVLGKPFTKYQEVSWHLAGQSAKPFRTRMPAQLLAHLFQVDHTLVLIPDSLSTGGSTYLELQEQPEELLPDEAWEGFNGELHRFVLPSRYSAKVLGDVRDFYQAGMFFLARWFSEHLSEPNAPLELYLETSTGLNILQLLTYRMVREIAGALAFFRQVSLEVYNADPVGQSTTQGEIFPTEIYRPLRAALNRFSINTTPRLLEPYDRISLHPGQNPEYRGLRDEMARHWSSREVVAFLNSIYYGIPLGLIRWFCEKPAQIFEILGQLYNLFLKQARLLKTENPRFLRPVRLGPDFTPYALGALLSNQIQSCWPFFDTDLKRHGATYQQMRSIMGHIYRDHPVIRNRFEAEPTIQQERLNCSVFPALLSHCLGYNDVCESINKRNFFAHAGFERCAVKVDRRNGEIYFRFAEEKENTIQNFLRGA